MGISKYLGLLGLVAMVAGSGAQAQRVSSPGQRLGANPPPVSAPAAPRPSTTPSAPAMTPAAPRGATAPGGSGLPAGGDAGADQTYILGPADVVEVSVLGRSDYTTRARIGEDGTILLQYLGRVNASNKTASQLSDEIASALQKGGFFSNPVVRVDVVSYASRYVTVLG